MAVDQVDPLISSIYHWMDVSGVLLMGIIGGTLARQLGYDIVGFFFIAMLSALGGGMLRDVLALGFRGYVRMADYAPPLVRGLLVGVTSLTAWVVSFIPRGVGRDPTLGQQETVG